MCFYFIFLNPQLPFKYATTLKMLKFILSTESIKIFTVFHLASIHNVQYILAMETTRLNSLEVHTPQLIHQETKIFNDKNGRPKITN